MLVKLQESGISLEYRCPSCRDCSSCKSAPDTERISLREEAEDQAMKDAVRIDFERKKITCSLPLRGKEEEFLSDNREVALKVLNSQCKKVQNDDEAKATAIKSFYKLFDGGYAVRFKELSPEHQEIILGKKIQHYLPWRLVHKQSISTPCRTVMDASSKTPLLKNGKGGRCLNDLTMKGELLGSSHHASQVCHWSSCFCRRLEAILHKHWTHSFTMEPPESSMERRLGHDS